MHFTFYSLFFCLALTLQRCLSGTEFSHNERFFFYQFFFSCLVFFAQAAIECLLNYCFVAIATYYCASRTHKLFKIQLTKEKDGKFPSVDGAFFFLRYIFFSLCLTRSHSLSFSFALSLSLVTWTRLYFSNSCRQDSAAVQEKKKKMNTGKKLIDKKSER